ncbi:hopanoid biosynthesis associated membrane protein HpnM [Desulfocurvibacter africanus PCS]|uniref:Hopanoid biosynthesis associated membrane protein HpnM n=1 Tax=Desulfocurvibacter africanus PCS TaxID=1262666 RepID=M5PXQ0_DESAF|nr:ABC transporter substrate-binding protein [Desulfocurvibacter africanus]EMG39077.1 hopanoid biosynthesis associated membrane protein HpnM [Desulfocurvibacter africanus PCS]
MPWKPAARLLPLAVLLAVLAALPIQAAWAAQTAAQAKGLSPAETIERLDRTLLSAMRGGEKLGFEGRYKLLFPVIDTIFADRFMARFSAGRFWRDFSDKQKRQYSEAYLDWSVSAYAERFDSYNGQRFDITKVDTQGDQATVVSTLTRTDGKTVDFTYKLRAQEGRWLIVDIIVRDVSQLAMTRSQFTSILGREGFDALMTKLAQKMQVYSEELSS